MVTRVMYDASASAADPRALPLLLNVRQASELLNVSEKHVRDLCVAGKIKGVKVGSAWRVGRDALLEQFGITGTRETQGDTAASPEKQSTDNRAEIVIRIELPAELADRLADARVVVTAASRSGKSGVGGY